MIRLRTLAARLGHVASDVARHDLTPVVLIMGVVRLLAIVALRPGGYVAETGPDSPYHFQLGRLAASGAYPFADYWTEYPPFFPWLSLLAYRISVLMPSWIDQRFWFNLGLHTLMIPFDALSAVLIYRISKRATGEPHALKSAWLYATLFVPMFVVLGWFESVALAAVLLALWLILLDRPIPAGIVIGLGVLVKPYVALIGAVGLIHLTTWRKVGAMIGAGALALLAGIAPFLIRSPQMVKAHIDTLLTLPGWSSPYALIDGVLKHADPKLASRFDPVLAAQPLAPTQVPWWLVTLAFGGIYGLILIRSYRHQHTRGAVGLAGVTFAMYLLWSKGYSPQWSLYLMAFLCILMPNLRGVLMLIILEVLYVIEWPITFILLDAQAGYLAALIAIRSLAIAGLVTLFAALIFVKREAGWRRLRAGSLAGSLAGLVGVVALAIGALPAYAAQRLQAEPMREAVDLIRASSAPERAGILFDRVDTFERLVAFLPGWPALAALRIGGPADAWSEARVASFARERAELWYVVDFGAEQHRATGDAIDRRLGETLCLVSRQFAGTARVARYVRSEPSLDIGASARFGGSIDLIGARVSGAAAQGSEPICVELRWRAVRTPTTDYIVFVHLIDANGVVVAQSDLAPGNGFIPATSWQPADVIVDRRGLVASPDSTAGTYRIVVGLYDSSGQRLSVQTENGVVNNDSLVLTSLEIGAP